ncbi:MAG: PAS domain S-box protein [Deltaproteobacteria bacterium]|nr:PAS domain S-box protein [Deltaproteobacteria bacterium]
MKKILVVDNDKLILEFARDLLQEKGHIVKVAEDGLEALDILKTYFPDIIFSDLVMPNIDGRKLCRSIREMHQHADCWIAVMSALAAEESMNPVELGADIVIAKGPLAELGRIIASVVENPEEYRRKCRMGQVPGLEDMWPRQITQELLSAKQHVEVILEKMKEGILEIEVDGRILSANAKVRTLTRLSEGDLLGAKFIALFPPEHRHRVEEMLTEKETGKEITEEDPVLFHGHLVTLSIIPLKDHAVVIINDITERKRKERELRESQDQFRFLVDNMLDAAVIVDPKGKTLFANKAAAELVGIESLEEGVGMNVENFIHPECRKAVMRNYLTAKKDRNTFLNEYKIVTPDGEEKDVEGHGTNITFKGMPAYIATLRDITERKKAEKQIRDGIVRLSKNLEETVISLASAFEMKDPYTAGHQRRVTQIASAIALEMNLDQDTFQGLRLASLVHDIGKINVPAEILSKPGKLSSPEFELIRTHSAAGYDILKKINFPWPISKIVLQHHERMDGSGYPNGLSGEKILLEARIIAVADVVEAMATHRPYRASLGIEMALEEIEANRGVLYDKDVARICLKLFRSGKFHLEID